jgi:hypothetical protein
MPGHPARNIYILGEKFLVGLDAIIASMPEPERDPRYWDCQCVLDYIHPVDQECCELCGAAGDESPHSLVSEVPAGLPAWRS